MNPHSETLTLGEALAEAVERHKGGDLQSAATVYREVLEHDPHNVQIMYLLALCEHQLGHYGRADSLLRDAVERDGSQARFHLALGRNHKQQGHFAQAVACYRRALQLAPGSVDAMVSLGIALWRSGQVDEGVAVLTEATQLAPEAFEPKVNLANALLGADRYDEAIDAYRKVLALRPDSVEALNNLGRACILVGQPKRARECFDRVLQLAPDYAEALFNLGEIHFFGGAVAEGAKYYAKAVTARPQYAEGYLALGRALFDAGQMEGALESFGLMAQVAPASPLSHIWRAMVLRELSRGEEALAALRQAVGLARDPADVHIELGETYYQLGNYAKAEECMALVPEASPAAARAFNLEGNLALLAGRADDAVAAYDRADALQPDFPVFVHNALFSRNYSDSQDSAALVLAHRNWGGRRPSSHDAATRRAPATRREGCLRIGFVSPDFRGHSVAHFISPILAHLDKARFESYCYANNRRADAVTEMQRRYATGWREIAGKSDQVVADMISRDRINVLVDLAGHTAENRLGVFARAPAPVSITYLGYPTTTGLPAIHYRLTDWVVDPEGSEAMNTEALLRLPDSYFCYMTASEAPASLASPPALRGNGITFGSFNNLAKMTPSTLRLWARVLDAVPGSKLMLKNRSLGDAGIRDEVLARLAQAGIAESRVDLRAFENVRVSHLALYNSIDIALDTSPYNGATTTCEALWMGVPVVTLRGSTHASRMGASILSAARLRDYIAEDEDGYVDTCVALASDLTALAGLRAGLRSLMVSSPLMQHRLFARHFEQAVESAWQRNGNG